MNKIKAILFKKHINKIKQELLTKKIATKILIDKFFAINYL